MFVSNMTILNFDRGVLMNPGLATRKAAANGHLNTLHFIFKNLVDDQVENVLIQTSSNGNSPIDWAINKNHPDCVFLLCNKMIALLRSKKTEGIQSLYDRVMVKYRVLLENSPCFSSVSQYHREKMQKG